MPKSILTDSQKERIYQLKKDGFSQTKIAELYGVSQGTISNALKDQSHKEEISMYKQQQTNAMAMGVAAVQSGTLSITPTNYIEKK